MSDKSQKNMLKRLLLGSNRKSSLWAALTALCVGTTLLLLAVMIWWNFSELLYGKQQNDDLGSTFIVVGKKVTDANMGQPKATVFEQTEMDSLKHAPQVQETGIISSNHFPVYAMMGGSMAFATDMPLESVPDNFIDKLPSDWKWKPGDHYLPIIVSSQFLDLYNYVFAPSQGLPQLSESSVKAIALNMKIGKDGATETVLAHVVGFSDRIGSVLAPQSFIDYGNKTYGKPGVTYAPSQLILKTKDPSDKKFGEYITNHNYTTNSQNLRWSKMREIVEVVSGATGILALLLMGISTLVFILFIELTVARARHSITLLMQLGYSPRFLGKFMSARFLPMVAGSMLTAAAITVGAQYVVAQLAIPKGLTLPLIPGMPVWGALGLSFLILLLLISRSIASAIKNG